MGAAQFWTAELRGPGAATGPVTFPDGIAGDEVVGPSADAVRAFLILSGTQGSQWEASSFNVLFDRSQGVSLSATEYLTYAALRGVPIHTVTAQNLNAVLPLLQVSEQVRTDIVNAAQAGYTAIVPQRDLNVLGQSGIGYIIRG